MKKVLILALMQGAVPSLLPAQTTDFAPVGARWYINQIVLEPIPADSFVIAEVTGEEMMAGQMCRVISNLSGCGLPNPAHVFTRNDSVFFFSIENQQFELLYDFTAEAGSQWTIRGLSHFNQDVHVTVVETFYWHFGNDSLKTWRILVDQSYWDNFILEKAGNLWYPGPTYSIGCTTDEEDVFMPHAVRCYQENDSVLYRLNASTLPCDHYANISSTHTPTENGGFRLYPNPVRSVVHYQMPQALPGAELFIYNTWGRLIQRRALNDQKGAITLTEGSKGIYFWRLTQHGRPLQSGRLMVME